MVITLILEIIYLYNKQWFFRINLVSFKSRANN